jgi:hypothetical protein
VCDCRTTLVCARIVVCNSWLVRAWPEGTHGTDMTHINVESLPYEPSQMKCDRVRVFSCFTDRRALGQQLARGVTRKGLLRIDTKKGFIRIQHGARVCVHVYVRVCHVYHSLTHIYAHTLSQTLSHTHACTHRLRGFSSPTKMLGHLKMTNTQAAADTTSNSQTRKRGSENASSTDVLSATSSSCTHSSCRAMRRKMCCDCSRMTVAVGAR